MPVLPTSERDLSTEVDKHSEQRIPALDGIRGIAILLVLISHGVRYLRLDSGNHLLHLLVFGWSGVDLFFVLSGYLITGVLIRSRDSVNRATSFYARRVLRIFPIYYLSLSALFAISVHSTTVRSMLCLRNVTEHLVFFGFLQNWLVLWDQSIILNSIVGHFWSLAVEEQFYLIWPLIVWESKPRSLLRVCIGLAVGAFLVRLWLVLHFGPHYWIQPLTLTRGEGLLVGSALAAIAANYNHIPARALKVMAITGASILIVILFVDPAEFVDTNAGPYMYTIGITALGLLFGALVGSSQKYVPGLTPLLTRDGLRWMGKYSYGIYVYHIPVYLLVTHFLASSFRMVFPLSTAEAVIYVLCLMTVSCGFAFLSYWLIEARLLRLKRHFAPLTKTFSSVSN